MVKFQNLGSYRHAPNLSHCKATANMKNGMLVGADLIAETANLPAVFTGELYLVMSLILGEPDSPNDFVIKTGEFPRLFRMSELTGHIVDMDEDVLGLTYASVAVGDKLVASASGKLVKATAGTTYASFFKVIKKTGGWLSLAVNLD